MRFRLTIVIGLLIALVGCSAEAPEPVVIEQTAAPAAGATTVTSEATAPADVAATSTSAEVPAADEDAEADATAEVPATDADAEATAAPAADEDPAATAAAFELVTADEAYLSDLPPTIDLADAAGTTIADTANYFYLQTLFSEQEGTCLEGNTPVDSAVLGGAAFMDACQNVTGQMWKLTPAATEGYYRLQTRFQEEQNRCLEGNQIAPEAVLGGASFMNECADATGQQWKFVDAGDGTYRMQTRFLETENKCLEGNRLEPLALQDGAAFQDDCKDVTGQVWRLVPATDAEEATDREIIDGRYAEGSIIENTGVYYQIQAVVGDEDRRCLDGNGIAAGATLGGAAYLSECMDAESQVWFIMPTEYPDLYKLQPMSAEEQGTCLEGNLVTPDAMLDGAAFLNACSNATGQDWKFVAADDGTYRMQTAFLADQNKCLEGNAISEAAPLGGASFMNTCQDTAGQQWVLTPVEGTSTPSAGVLDAE